MLDADLAELRRAFDRTIAQRFFVRLHVEPDPRRVVASLCLQATKRAEVIERCALR